MIKNINRVAGRDNMFSWRAVGLYTGCAFLVSWVLWLPLYAPVMGMKGLPTIPLQHAIGALGPMLSALLITYKYHGKPGVRVMIRRMTRAKPFVFILIAIAAPVLLLVVTFVLHGLADGGNEMKLLSLRSAEFPEWNVAFILLYQLFFFGFGEETGWRGFLLPALERKMPALKAAVVLTVIWAAWHLPLFLYRPGYMGMHIADIIGWLISLLTGSVLLTWMYNSSRGSILVCALFHATIDIVFTARLPAADMNAYLGFLVTLWGMITIWIYRRPLLAKVVIARHHTFKRRKNIITGDHKL